MVILILMPLVFAGPENAKMIMATTLAEMELTDHNKSSLVEEGALDLILPLVSQGDVQLKEVAAKALQSLSSLPKNGLQMIRGRCVGQLLEVLYHPTSSSILREHIAVTIMHLAVSTLSPNSSRTQVSLLESDEDIDTLFSFASLPVPLVQQSILRAFHALCQSPSAAPVKAKLAQVHTYMQPPTLIDLHFLFYFSYFFFIYKFLYTHTYVQTIFCIYTSTNK